ncbi:MAG: hypothetical protein VX085_02640, partial [Pseudomonadota bacterium]|nr:hypothetical protein [Pseudomonadota bacterium]
MANYRDYLPQIDGGFFLTHGELETTSVLQGDVYVSHFAAIELMKTEKGRARSLTYYAPYINIARDMGAGYILKAPLSGQPPIGASGLDIPPHHLAPHTARQSRCLMGCASHKRTGCRSLLADP